MLAASVSTSADEVLSLFDELRGEIVAVLQRGEEIARNTGGAGESARPHLLAARQAADLSRLNLVVVGGEGQGKSTLINAILGVQVAPEESDQPGTVAPVYITYGRSEEPVYSVQVGDSEARLVDHAGFRAYLLQAENPDNIKNVRFGFVEIRHALLKRGLRMVDMPGVEGLSGEIAAEARAFIKTNANAVLGVMRRSGGYGPMGRILRTMLPESAEAHALVFNSDLTDWSHGPGTPKEESEQRAYIERQRKTVVNQLSESWPALSEKPDQVFILHLPSFHAQQLRDADRVWVGTPVHDGEAERFLGCLWTHVREHGVGEVIDRAYQHADAALRELKAWLDLRRQVLSALQAGGADLAVLQRKFETAQMAALAKWQGQSDATLIESLAEEVWQHLQPRLVEARDTLIHAIHLAENKVGSRSDGALSGDTARAIKADLELAIAAQNEANDEAYRAAVDKLLEVMLLDANTILDEFNEQLPVVQETIGAVPIDSKNIVRLRLGDIDPSILESLAHVAGVVGTAVAGGVGAKAGLLLVLAPFLGPIGALAVTVAAGASATAVVTHFALTRLRDPHRRGLLQGLLELRESITHIDTSAESELRRAWGETASRFASDVGRALKERIANIRSVLNDPTGNRHRVEAEHARVERLGKEIDSLEHKLGEIADRAASVA